MKMVSKTPPSRKQGFAHNGFAYSSTDVIRAVEAALAHLRAGKHDPVAYHEAVKGMYSWSDVAARLERVYAGIIDAPMPDSLERFEK